ncbi:hypothetical protein RND81_13G205500 [Saponaria officinalis]|uniref:Ribosomal protein L20 n=1 Tax=Saponaria officinalis TaxID=3572 RepID=A0AAW1H3B4_SAPOF
MNNIYEMGYNRVNITTKCNGFRGIRLNIRKISIHRLRVRFRLIFKMLYKWRSSYERAMKSIKKGICGKRSLRKNSKSRLILQEGVTINKQCRLKSLTRTNSFYTEAINDCLEFIKRNSVSLDDPHDHIIPCI